MLQFDRRVLKNLAYVLVPLYVFLFLASVYHFVYARKIIPGVKVGSVKVGGLSYEAAKKKLGAALSNVKTDLPLKSDRDFSFTIGGEDIELKYDIEGSLDRAFEVGRAGNFYIDNKDKIAGLVKNLYLPFYHSYNNEALDTKLALVKGELDVMEKNASVAFDKSEVVLVPSAEGQKVDSQVLYNLVIWSFDRMDFTAKNIPVEKAEPNISSENISPLLEEAKKILSNQILIVYSDKKWVIDENKLLDLMTFSKTDGKDGKARILMDSPKFEALVSSLSQEVNQLPRGQVTKTEGSRVLEFEIVKSGVELDTSRFSADFKNAYFNAGPKVDVAVKEISAPGDRNKYGIFALLGEGTSKYTGSASGRIHNLILAAQRTNGVLVPPGAIYSMNNAVGEISARTGYNAAYIISNGRTVLGEGGGVCQTSTTLFRAILNAGLPIVMRYSHAYRVRYYEIDSPVGFDATVYQPSVDLQFKNDTPGYILVQSSADINNDSLTFRLYGTPDGREVDISEPIVTNVSAPPAVLYQDDPTLPKGVVKQVDFAAWGASVSFTRIVKKEGKIIYRDTINSVYQPWRAIFLVGTKS